jgi:Zn-dependent protease with chaperone function
MMIGSELTNPTQSIDLSFSRYLQDRHKQFAEHWINGAPDYCFSLDRKMHQRLASIKPFHMLAKAATSFTVMLQKALYNLRAIAVGPQQYPNIHAIGVECARRLGIGVPQIYIIFDPTPNAFTFASNDQGDAIVIHSCMVERFTEDELLFVLGHECGHIHNLHAAYRVLIEQISNPALIAILNAFPGYKQLAGVLKLSVGFFLLAWGRCQELTSDRAGLICCGNLETARAALAKLTTAGGPLGNELNVEQLAHQLESVRSTPLRLLELQMGHPIVPKRLEAIRLFEQSDTLYGWRPEMRKDHPVLTAREVDDRCEKIVRVIGKGYKASDQ